MMNKIKIMSLRDRVKAAIRAFRGQPIGSLYFGIEVKRCSECHAVPVKHGWWFEMVDSKLDTHTGEYYEEVYYNCLECDYASDWKSPYCPNCGCKMEVDNG